MNSSSPTTGIRTSHRDVEIDRLSRGAFDALVIGGGVTGCGVALDLALRGLSVALIERGDFANATSSASSRLIHGGLRYLEQYQFAFVREALRERAILARIAPDHVRPEPFLFALRDTDRVGPLMLRAGLTMYGLLSLPHPIEWPRMASRREIAAVFGDARGALPRGLTGGGFYSDGATHDARLTLALADEARAAGALALTRVEALDVDSAGDEVRVHAIDHATGASLTIRSRSVVLAAGPFTDDLRRRFHFDSHLLATTRGAHIVLRGERLRLRRSVIFTSGVDGRVVFLLRWGTYTAVGTTDVDADPNASVSATPEEVRYLVDSANSLLPDLDLREHDVLCAVAGLRPLLHAGDRTASQRSREETILEDGPLFTIAGGKLTGYRAIAEKVGARVALHLRKGDPSPSSPTRTHRIRPTSPEAGEFEERFRARDLDSAKLALDRLFARESLLTPADVVLRRTDLGLDALDVAQRAIEWIERHSSRKFDERVLRESRDELAIRHSFRNRL